MRWALSLVLGWLLVPAPPAVALDPRRSLTQYRSRVLGPEDGLPCNGVVSVTQGSDGYLWLGTEEGLVRYDGVRARVFDRRADPTMLGNYTSSAVEDARFPGQVLFGGVSGLRRLAGEKIRALAPGAIVNGQYAKILLQDPLDGALWVQTLRGLCRLDPDGRRADPPLEAAPGWPADKVRAVCRDAAGTLWVGTGRGLLRQRRPPARGATMTTTTDPGFELLPAWADKGVEYLLAARGGGLWVGSSANGTGRLDPAGTFHPRPALAGCTVTAVLEDRAGMLWVGTFGSGLFRLPAAEGPAEGDPAAPAAAATVMTTGNGLVRNIVNGLCEDREGNLWIATGIGLQVLRDTRFVNYGVPEGLAGNDARTIFEDEHRRLWIGHDQGLSVLAPGEEQRVTNYPLPPSPQRPADNHVLCVDRGDEADTLLLGTISGLVRWREDRLEPCPLREDLDHSKVRSLCRDAAGDRWVGTSTGLYRVRGREVLAHLTTVDGLAGDAIHALHVDRRGNLWIGTLGGLSCRGPDGRIVNFLGPGDGRPLGRVDCLLEDPGDPAALFFGTTLGLHRLRFGADGTPRITSYTVQDGLFDDLVTTLLEDGQGNLWMSSNRGISRVARADLDRFDRRQIAAIPHVSYGLNDGLRSREGNGGHQPAAWRDHAGQLWFATGRGAVAVDPARVTPNPLPPPVRLEEALADGRAFVPPPSGEAGIGPGTQKLDFRYTALSLVVPGENRFRYRLEGFDTAWTEANTERTAHYTNLAPGAYRFQVQAANADGVWNLEGAALAFRLQPFFYQTPWFRGLVVAAGLGLLWAGQQRLRVRWQRQLALARAELTEKTRQQEVLRQAKEQAEAAHRAAERSRAEAEHARVAAERADAAKGEFLSRMSHELRTPLNAILGFGQLLDSGQLSPVQGDCVGYILSGGRHLLGLVDEILDLARVESGQAHVRLEPVALAPLFEELTGLILPLAGEGGVRLRVEEAVPGAEPVHVRADRPRLKQVLLNLLVNAVKYHKPTGGEVVVGTAETAAGEQSSGGARWRIFVRDDGIGIDADGRAKLWAPFERLGAVYGPIEGTGLGLAVSKQLVQVMGGTIGVESIPGVGSTFWVELPAVPAPAPARLPAAARPGPPPAEPADRLLVSRVPRGAPCLLYVEDFASNRDLLASILDFHRPDLTLRSAPDGLSGLEAARAHPRPDLILLDLQLPDIGGDEVLERLRADPLTAPIPVVILSADATGASQARLRAAGATDYLTKPFNMARLLQVFADHLPAAPGDDLERAPTG